MYYFYKKITNYSKKILKSKYPVVRQYDQIDCGPAALLSILKFWGGNTNLPHVRELARTDARGTNMLGLVNAAKKLGFEAFGATGSYEDLMKERMPCIAHVILENNLQHFVVIYEINDKKVLIGDPAKGRYWLSKDNFLKIWQNKAVVLLTPQRKLINNKTLNGLSWVFSYFKREDSWLYQSIFLGILYTLFGLLVAIFVQWLIDRFIPERDIFKILITGIFLLMLQLLRALAGYLRQRFLVELNKRVNVNINKDFLNHIFHLPLDFFDTRKKGDITARINDSIKIQQALMRIVGVTIIDGLIIFGSLIFIFLIASHLGWIVLATLPLYTLLLFYASKNFKTKQNEVMKSYAQVESFYFDGLNGMDEILSYNASKVFAQTSWRLFKKYQDNVAKLGLTQAKISLYAEFAAGSLMVGVLSYGAILVIRDIILLGQMMAAYSLLANMLPAVNRLVEANISLQGASVAIRRLMDLFLVEKEKDLGTKPFTNAEILTIKNLQFIWTNGKILYHDLNLSIPKRRITSLWGISGSGKTTLIKIIQRKYEFPSGEISINSTPIYEFKLQSYRKGIGVVPQKVKIFNGTILENILMGRHIKDIKQVMDKINKMGFNKFIYKFNQGLFTLIGEEGQQLSSGEMQILGLIRALYDEPEILIIDEGISSIDIEMEHLIFKVLRNYAKNHAVLIITHNLQTILKTDYVYLLVDGKIQANGSPDILLKNNTRFRKLWEIQNPNIKESIGRKSIHVI